MRPDTGFRIWLGAATLSTLGDSITFFAVGWIATSMGAGAAGLVLTVGSVPLCLFILVGGSVADRYGVRRVLACCDAAMVVVMVVLAVASTRNVSIWLLAAAEFLSGTAAALRRPAEGVMPRLFSAGDDLARRMATVSGALQLARVVGPALGGLLLAAGGLPVTSSLDALTFLLALVVLVSVRPPHEGDQVVTTPGRGWRSVVDGVRTARCTPGVPRMLLVLAGLAGTVLPYVMLCVPLVGRQRGWSPGEVGLVTGAWTVGGLVVTAVVARRGKPRRSLASVGPLLAGAGALVVAASTELSSDIAATFLIGVGTTTLTARVLPDLVTATPPDMLARFQSLAGLAQTGPVLAVVPSLGVVAVRCGVTASVVVVAAGLVLTALAYAVRWPTRSGG